MRFSPVHPPAPDADGHEADERNPGDDEHRDAQREGEIHPAEPGRDAAEEHRQDDGLGEFDVFCGLFDQNRVCHVFLTFLFMFSRGVIGR